MCLVYGLFGMLQIQEIVCGLEKHGIPSSNVNEVGYFRLSMAFDMS